MTLASAPIRGGRLNTRLEWQGAEFLVLAHLLIEGIEAYKPYVNHPGYDLVALNPNANKLARISVKSRWATNRAGHFPLNSLDCDFVVHVALNRGERLNKVTIDTSIQGAQLYILPIDVCTNARSMSNKMNLRNIPNVERFESNWDLIKKFLEA
ncbi:MULTISPECIES: group I intron-associated PD-(D/E)XK endonuclease [unclassified Afipia]|uniref:group I intron-associated PD-(D/E)XK endonuclease n=1 Tax=unclassified Afipia TaxID=2642050 RepID=UPI000463BE54|nr:MULTISPECIES: group I intron-associated PD-(D/E)XK endonuclease [unclassified Afipia]